MVGCSRLVAAETRVLVAVYVHTCVFMRAYNISIMFSKSYTHPAAVCKV